MALSRSANFLLIGAVAALLAVVAVSLQHEMRFSPPRDNPKPVDVSSGGRPPAADLPSAAAVLPPLTSEEEAFAEALWPLHQEVVEASAGRLTSAGLSFAIDDHDAGRLVAKVAPLRQVFHETRDKVAAIATPASMRQVHDRYVALLGLYERSASEMMEVGRDGDEGHLLDAQQKSEHAAQELVKVGDILWPGEHKPN